MITWGVLDRLLEDRNSTSLGVTGHQSWSKDAVIRFRQLNQHDHLSSQCTRLRGGRCFEPRAAAKVVPQWPPSAAVARRTRHADQVEPGGLAKCRFRTALSYRLARVSRKSSQRGGGRTETRAWILASADNVAADVPAGGCGHAPAVNHVHSRSASLADLRGHIARLLKRRAWHRLHRCCDGQCKDNSGQPDHFFLLLNH